MEGGCGEDCGVEGWDCLTMRGYCSFLLTWELDISVNISEYALY